MTPFAAFFIIVRVVSVTGRDGKNRTISLVSLT